MGLFICRGLDGTRSVPQIAAAVRDAFNGAPDEVGEQVQAFVDRTFAGEPTVAARYARFNETAGRSPRGSAEPCRALMETIARDMRAKVDALALAGLRADRLVMVGGPTESQVWTQILADELGLAIELPASGAFAGALGAAILAGIGQGIFPDETSGFARIRSGDRTVQKRTITVRCRRISSTEKVSVGPDRRYATGRSG